KVSTFFIALISRARHPVGNGSGLLACPSRFRRRFELEGQLVDLAGELERDIVAILHHRDPGTGVLADVERFVLWERDRDSVFQGLFGYFLSVHGQDARAALAPTCTVGVEVED